MSFFFNHINWYFSLVGWILNSLPLCGVSCKELHWWEKTPLSVLVQTCEKANLKFVLPQRSLDHFGSVLLITTVSLDMQFNFLWFSSSVLGKTGLDPYCSFLLTLSENLERKAVSALRLTSPSPHSFSQVYIVIGSAQLWALQNVSPYGVHLCKLRRQG